MTDAAPTEVLQYTDDQEKDFQKKVKDLTDVFGKTAGHTFQAIGGEEGPLTHVETASGSKVASFMKEKMQRLGWGIKKAA